jgi:SAM-dependent methyltransferase
MWDERYAQEGLAYGEDANSFLVSQEQRIRAGGRRALSLAEGEGRNAVWLASLGLEVTAVDLSIVGLQKASARAKQLGLSIRAVEADLGKWVIEPDHWDLIVSIFGHLPREVRASLYQQVVRGLAKGGLFILEAYTPSQITRGTGGPKDLSYLPSEADLRRELQGLHFLECREISREVIEGRYHTGIADVVQIVAQKQ